MAQTAPVVHVKAKLLNAACQTLRVVLTELPSAVFLTGICMLLQMHDDHGLLLENVPEVDAAQGAEDEDDDFKPNLEDVIQGAQQVC